MSRPALLLPLALALAAIAPAAATAQAPAPQGTISASGAGSVTPTPLNRKSNASIAKAVADAQAAALPLAIKAGQQRAQLLAKESGLALGALISISDQAASPFFPYNSYGVDGTFGPGRYCGNVARYRTQRRANGSVKRTRIGTRRLCRIPSRVGTNVTVTYATAPPAS